MDRIFLLTTFCVVLFSPQDETVDLRQIYLSVAALSGLVSFKSLLHTAFTVRPVGLFLTFRFEFFLFGKCTAYQYVVCFPAVWQRGQWQSECGGSV